MEKIYTVVGVLTEADEALNRVQDEGLRAIALYLKAIAMGLQALGETVGEGLLS
jgi:hypothetical protein